GGLTDTVIDEVTGLLVPPRDARAAALALRTLCRDDARRFGFGLAGHQRVQARYSWDRIAADTEAVYRRIAPEADLGGRDGAPARAVAGRAWSAAGAPCAATGPARGCSPAARASAARPGPPASPRRGPRCCASRTCPPRARTPAPAPSPPGWRSPAD